MFSRSRNVEHILSTVDEMLCCKSKGQVVSPDSEMMGAGVSSGGKGNCMKMNLEEKSVDEIKVGSQP